MRIIESTIVMLLSPRISGGGYPLFPLKEITVCRMA